MARSIFPRGFPDFEPAEALLDRVTHYLKSGKNQYPPMIGVPELRQSIAGKIKSVSGIEIDPETEITITSGATEALFCAIHALVRPGDEVIVFDPAYDSYRPAISLAGGKNHTPAVDITALPNRLGCVGSRAKPKYQIGNHQFTAQPDRHHPHA